MPELFGIEAALLKHCWVTDLEAFGELCRTSIARPGTRTNKKSRGMAMRVRDINKQLAVFVQVSCPLSELLSPGIDLTVDNGLTMRLSVRLSCYL